MQTRLFSAAEQVAERLRNELVRGRWSGTLPGIHRLSAELGLPRKPVERALLLLEQQGLLVPQGAGRRRQIVIPKDSRSPSVAVKILHFDELDRTLNNTIDLQHRLMEEGHAVSFTPKSLKEMGMDVKRVARVVRDTKADAWVIRGGSREVLEYFANQAMPAFAIFGDWYGVRIAGIGPQKLSALQSMVGRLVALGHRRIVMMLGENHLKPQPNTLARTFLDELKLHGIPASVSYNLPEWEDSGEGFRSRIDSLFHATPPSALILDEAYQFNAAQLHLARRGLLAPKHVSLVCLDPDEYGWAHPSIAHIRWDPQQVVRRVVRWAENVARGKDDRRQTLIKAEFVEGGSIGPAPRG